jgi:hypothetical protein
MLQKGKYFIELYRNKIIQMFLLNNLQNTKK